MSFDGFTARAKAGSNPFSPQGVHVGIVRRRDVASQTVWVELPRVAEGFEFGPVRVSSTVLPLVGQNVSCVFVEDVTDDIIVLGAVRDPSTPPIAADTADRLSVARTIALGDYLAGSASFDGSANITINATPSATMDARYFNASNLASGTVPSARVAGAYTGITGLGTLNQTLNIGIAGATPAVNLTMTHPDQAAIVVGASADPTSNRASIFLGGWLFGRDSVLDGRNDFFFYDGTATRLAISAAGVISGDGGGLTNLNATNLASGTVASARIAGAYTGITSVGTLGSLAVTAGVTAATFTGAHSGDGSALTALNATQLTTGTVPTGRMTGAYTGITSIANLTTTAVNEVQTLSITGSPTGGTFTIYVMNQPLVIAYNASAATIQTNVQALAGVGSGNITCTGGNLPGTPVVFTFTGALAGTNVMPIEIGLNSLTGGTTPTPAIAQTTAGVGTIGSTSVSSSATISGLSGIFDSVYTDRIYLSNTGSVPPITVQMNHINAMGLQINASTHATSRRAGITMGTWLVGQDVNSNGGLDFFIWNGATRLSIAATGAVGVGTLNTGAINTTGKVTIAAGSGAEILKVTGETSYMAFYADDGATRRGYVQGAGAGLNIGADASGTVAVIGALTTTLGITASTNIYAVGQVKAARNGGTSGSGATDGWYYNASFYASAADVYGTGVTASIAFHPGGYAPQLRTSNAYHGIFVRDSTGNTNISMEGFAFTATSTRRVKKNISSWPARSLSSAAVDALSLIDQLRPVSYNRIDDRMAWVPTTQRRREALLRLHEYQAARGLPLHVEYHDCVKHECSGTADSPCPEMINHNRTNIGLIAEEVYEVFPEAVTLDEHGAPRALNYAMFSVVALAGIKELSEQVKQLKALLDQN